MNTEESVINTASLGSPETMGTNGGFYFMPELQDIEFSFSLGEDRILIIGGTGSLGSALVERYVGMGANVSVLSRDPHKQKALAKKFPDVEFHLGDICDIGVVEQACLDKTYVVHAAALKHVDMGEEHVDEYVRVNIDGSRVVAEVCHRMGIQNVLFISSDKGCSPVNLYGKTKAVSEDIFLSKGFSALRYGNVVFSQGSMIFVWNDALRGGDEFVWVRTPIPTRFFMTIEDAVDCVVEALGNSALGTLFVPHNLKAFGIRDLALAYNIPYRTTPLLPGEKQHEILISPSEYAVGFSDSLSMVYKGYSDEAMDRKLFCSKTAPRMTLDEIHYEFDWVFNGWQG